MYKPVARKRKTKKKRKEEISQDMLSGIHGGSGNYHNQNSLMALLKSCAKKKDLNEVKRIHADILKRGLLENDIYFGNSLVHLYAKCGALEIAEEIFSEIQVRDVITWNALIAGYAQHGYGKTALDCFNRMHKEGNNPDAVTFVCTLKACSNTLEIKKGKELHAEIIGDKSLEKNVYIGSALVDLYAKCGELTKARKIFDKLQSRNIVCWNALISGYAHYGYGEEALDCFAQMQWEGLSPDSVTYVCILKACGRIKAAEKGREIHQEIVRLRFLGKDTFIGTALLDMYAKCGDFSKAQEVFNQLPSRNVVSWNSLIAGYVQHNQCEQAITFYYHMRSEGFSPDIITFVCVVKACGIMRAVDKGEEIHAEIKQLKFIDKSILICNALVQMYVKCGVLAKANEVFDGLQVRDVVSWTTLISGYAEHGHGEEALGCFEDMENEGPSPNSITYVCALGACGNIGAVVKGREIHVNVVREGLLEENVLLGNAVVDMYAKCGALEKAHEVFDQLLVRDIVSWNVLIAGYAQFGKEETVELFNQMISEGIEPDLVTFTVMLNACSDLGLLDIGQMYFEGIGVEYAMIPTFEHYTCMVDLFSRAGQFEKAIAVAEEMPTSDYLPVWTSLLGACQKWGNVEFGRLAFEHAVRLDEKHVATYVCMRNIYITANMADYAAEIDAMKRKNCCVEDEFQLCEI